MTHSNQGRWLLFPGVLVLASGVFLCAGGFSQRQDADPPPDTDDLLLDDDLLDEDDDLLDEGDELLVDEAPSEAEQAEATLEAVNQAHNTLFLSDQFPSARSCGTCHPNHYREWSVSQHAYAQMSPVFNAMHGKILLLTNGTNGDFCIRCHTPVGMNLGEPEFMSNIDRHPTSREGVTCIVCHRVNKAYGKLSGRLALVEGDIFTEVYGPSGNDELTRVLANSDQYRGLVTEELPGRKIHADAVRFFQLPTSGFCGTCHDVTLVNGFRLEEAFSEFKASPAAKRGISCQDCHMGTEPGVPSGYAEGPAAIVGGVETTPRKLTNHLFIGPDHSVIHPGIFPIDARAIKEENLKDDPTAEGMATIREWLEFDYAAGWGTDEFEDNVGDGFDFPNRWESIDDRYDAREIVDSNLALLAWANEERLKILRVGYLLGDVIVDETGPSGIRFRVEVKNGTDGHGVPTGFDAERLVWLEVTVRGADGVAVMQSGDLDPNGDVRDLHSLYVHNGELPLDEQLFSLQSRFLTRMVRGGEREQVLAVNYSPDPLPFLRPSTDSSVLRGRPFGTRKHKQNIEPLGVRWASYVVSKDALSGSGPYQATIRLKAGMVPVNLINEIKDVGFDYFMSPRQVADAVQAGHLTVWERNVDLVVEPVSGN